MYITKEFYGAHDMYDYYLPKDIYASFRNPALALPRRVLSFLTILVPFSIFWLLLSYDRLPSYLSKGPTGIAATTHWHGWPNVENVFVFGDSYTSSDFDPKKEQPSLSNPFGNPALPKSSSIHQKWIHYLTMTYNSSAIRTYNMASYGATMDAFVRFYYENYMPYYGIANHTGAAGWNGTNSLFATFFGINDVRRCTDQPLTKDRCGEIYAGLFTIYGFLLEQLYATGARNFLLLTIPPLDRMPFSRKWGHPVPPRAVADWNTALASLAAAFTQRHADATLFRFDAHALFAAVMDDPTAYPQTERYLRTADNCEEYHESSDKDDWKEVCGVSVERYLWRDALHPTTGVHEAMAAQIAGMLEGDVEKGGG